MSRIFSAKKDFNKNATEFMKDLQKRLIKDREEETNQASPLMYKIREPKLELTEEDFHDIELLVDEDGEAFENINEYIKCKIDNNYDKETITKIIKDLIKCEINGKVIITNETEIIKEIELKEENIDEIEKNINETNFDYGETDINIETEDYIEYEAEEQYMNIEKLTRRFFKKIREICPSTFFLTREEAKQHLKTNGYHYNAGTDTYALTPFRSYDYEDLLNVLHLIDWEKTELKMKVPYSYVEERLIKNTYKHIMKERYDESLIDIILSVEKRITMDNKNYYKIYHLEIDEVLPEKIKYSDLPTIDEADERTFVIKSYDNIPYEYLTKDSLGKFTIKLKKRDGSIEELKEIKRENKTIFFENDRKVLIY